MGDIDEALESIDGVDGLRILMGLVAARGDEWAGLPVPLPGIPLEIDDKQPFASKYVELQAILDGKVDQEYMRSCTADDVGCSPRSGFYCSKIRAYVWTSTRSDGKVVSTKSYGLNPLGMQVECANASDAWTVEQEKRALDLLEGMLRPRQFEMYFLTGMFLEESRRSGVMYVFRKLRPTVALGMHDPNGKCRILCALCMHPVAYYRGSFAGAMCPTDDVIAHLALMRGDEHMFWKRCNQHPAHLPNAGI